MGRVEEWTSWLPVLALCSTPDEIRFTIHASRRSQVKPEDFFSLLLARIIHECRREAFETEARRGCSHVRPTQAYWQSVEEAEREQPRRATGSDAGAGIHE
jgi:hypothetical protein